jgi:cupin 2 domain-containing protein
MAEEQLQQFLKKVQQLNAFVALSEEQPALRRALQNCSQHHEVVMLAAQQGFDIGRRWGDNTTAAQAGSQLSVAKNQSNLLSSPCPEAEQERIDVLAEGNGWRLERIHSCQARTADQTWYDQHEHEWVLVLRGSAQVHFEGEEQPRDLCVGDCLMIAPHQRHRVLATDPAPGTIWLALFWWEAEPSDQN